MDTGNLGYYCKKVTDNMNKHEIINIFDTKKTQYVQKTINNIIKSNGLFKYTYNLSKIIRYINKKLIAYKKNKILIKLKKYLTYVYKQICINHSL